MELRDRVALVTGATGGLGRHIARALAGEGVHLALSASRKEPLAALAEELRALGVRAEPVAADLTDRAAVEALVGRAEEAVGALDVLVNNAGLELAGALEHADADEVERVVAVNLTAPLLLARAAVLSMLPRGRGHVVFVASVSGHIGTAYEAVYAATKAGLHGAARSLRAEFIDRPIGFSTVSPGPIRGEGMVAQLIEEGLDPPALVRLSSPEAVGAAVVRAIRRDEPDVLVYPMPFRPALVLADAAPRRFEQLLERAGLGRFFRPAAQARGRDSLS